MSARMDVEPDLDVLTSSAVDGDLDANRPHSRSDWSALPMSVTALTDALACAELIEVERDEARAIQRAMLPARPLIAKSFEIAHEFRAFTKVGGDFLDYFAMPDGRVGIYLGDVAGKGLPAALYAALVVGTLRGVPKAGAAPADVLELANRRLEWRSIPGRFCAMQYAVFDPLTLELRFTNAGLPLPLHLSPTQCDPFGEGGLPLGLFPGVHYEEHSIRLDPGDAVFFATDGLHESWNSEDEQLGVQRLCTICQQGTEKPALQMLDDIFEAVSSFSSGVQQHDDMAAIVLKTTTL